MALNEHLEFSSVDQRDQDAFIGPVEKIWLEQKTKVYKFTDYPLVNEKGNITPWWSFVVAQTLPSGRKMEGFRQSETAANRLRVSHREYQKYRAAISESFNNDLSNLVLAFLTEGVWAFAGITSGQKEFDMTKEERKKDPSLAKVYLIGGKGQLYIPNLRRGHLQEIPAIA